VFLQINHGNIRTLFREGDGDRAANPAVTARD
jgi:hypothetical protein